MRKILLLLAIPPALALNNSITITDRSGSTQTNRVFSVHRTFADTDVCDYPKPYIGGTAATTWQADKVQRWPTVAGCAAGYVKQAKISFIATIAANSSIEVDFRNSTNPCSSGDASACSSAGMSQSAMAAASWGTTLTMANDYGSGSCVFNPKTAISNGFYDYHQRGPVVTSVMARDNSSSLTYDCGFRERRLTRLVSSFGSTDTSFTVNDAGVLSGLSRPLTVNVDGEDIRICYVSASGTPNASILYVGTTNGSDASCATSAGRGYNSTTAAYHNPGTTNNWVRYAVGGETVLKWAAESVGNQTSISLVDASTVSANDELVADGEVIRVDSKTGNNLTVTRFRNGTNVGYPNGGSAYYPVGAALFRLTGMTDRRELATAAQFQSLHPEALVYFAGSQVAVQYYVSNYWSARGQDQDYSVTIEDTGGTPSTLKTVNNVRHVWRTRWALPAAPTATEPEAMYWLEGTVPGQVRVDYNLPYLRHAKLLPYDPAAVATQTAIDNVVTANTSWYATQPAWDNSDKCEPETRSRLNDATWGHVRGQYFRFVEAPGGRPELGVFSGQFAAAVASWGSGLTNAARMNDIIVGHGACAGSVPLHYRESSTSLSFCNSGGYTANTADKFCTVNALANAFGRVISVSARPLASLYLHNTSAEGDKTRPVGPVTASGHSVSTSTWGHTPNLAFGAYFLTGLPYYQEELLDYGGAAVFHGSDYPYDDWTSDTGMMRYRGGTFAAIQGGDGIRTWAWAMRDIGYAWWASIDGSPEQEYFASVLRRNAAYTDGRFYHTSSPYYLVPGGACDSTNRLHSPWWWGYCAGGRGWTGGATIGASLFWQGYDSSASGSIRIERAYNTGQPWMTGYALSALGQIERMGFTGVHSTLEVWGKSWNNRLTHPDYNPFLIDSYQEPLNTCTPEGTDIGGGCSGQAYGAAPFSFTSFANLLAAWRNDANACGVSGYGTYRGKMAFCQSAASDLDSGYARIARAAASYLADVDTATATGRRSWNWINDNLAYRNTEGDNPHWAYTPPETITNVRVGASNIIFTAPTGAACGFAWNPANSLDSGDTAIAAGPRTKSFSRGGYTTGDKYRITCGSARYTGTL